MNLLARSDPSFPPADRALTDPNGLLAVGGALDAEWLLAAYRHGIFPWFDSDEGPILWWCPDPRAVIRPEHLHISRSLAKRLRSGRFQVTADQAFEAVIDACARTRRENQAATGTWITPGMRRAYGELHALGVAHSVEVWLEDEGGARRLAGGLYGVSLGRMFFGESMFSLERDASKVALAHLARQLQQWGFWLIDCQVANPHLSRMGAQDMPRDEFIAVVEKNAHQPTRKGPWTLSPFPRETWRASNTTPSAASNTASRS